MGFRAQREALTHVHGAFDRFFADPEGGSAIADKDQIALRTAAAEIAANIVEHACGHLPDPWMSLRIELHDGRVDVEFEDPGIAYEGTPPNPVESLGQLRGRGMAVVRASVHTVAYSRAGALNRWRLSHTLS